MDLLLQQALAGLSTGGVYACMALALVMIYQAIGVVNFAQGEMATFSAFVAWQLVRWGVPYWTAFLVTVALSFAGGMAIDRVLFAPVRGASALVRVVVSLALLLALHAFTGWIWDFGVKPFPTPFGAGPFLGNPLVSAHDAGTIAVTGALLALLYLFFHRTRIGVAMRASAGDPESARLVGIRIEWMATLGWGMAAAIGAVAGMLIAPAMFLEPNMMLSVLPYAFAGAVAGGLTSPAGAVAGGLAVGVIENVIGAFVPLVGRELKLSLALGLIVAVLTWRPSGLFGREAVGRV